MRVVWFVLAGFLLGFSISTLWEWLYFRRRRMVARSGQPTRVKDKQPGDAGRAESGQSRATAERSEWPQTGIGVNGAPEGSRLGGATIDPAFEPEYESPGVFLEIEEAGEEPVTPPRPPGRRPLEDADEPAAPPDDSRAEERESAPRPGGAGRNPAAAPPGAAAPGARPPLARTSRTNTPDVYRLRSAAGEADAAYFMAEGAQAKSDPVPREDTPAKPAAASRFEPPKPAVVPRSKPLVTGQALRPAAPEPVTPPPPLEPVKEKRPAARKSANHPDDLAKIKGIGEVYKQRLYAAGIYTWHQIAQADEETLRTATQAYPSSNAHEWAEQAQQLAEKHGRTGAVYTGPPPNDLTRIYGIGPVGATTLYRAGICTYAQLAECTPQELAPLFPIAVAGDEPDFAHWIEQARRLSTNGGT